MSDDKRVSRRDFLKVGSTSVIGLGLGSLLGGQFAGAAPFDPKSMPASEGYLQVDSKKCLGCLSCMLACSLAHEGTENLSHSRIQIEQNSFGRFPNDTVQEVCRQCVFPACVDACPTGANHVDTANMNVRRVDTNKCIGCQRCVEACPFSPSRMIWNPEEKAAMKCDLCAITPHWKDRGGKQACVEICPTKAIKFTKEVPVQSGTAGYTVNLRGPAWARLGLPTD